MSNDTVIRPDLMVVCGDQPQRHLESPPALVVEVLSDSTRECDLVAKRALYSEQQVGHYLVVDLESRIIEHVTNDGTFLAGADGRLVLRLPQGNGEIVVECGRLFD